MTHGHNNEHYHIQAYAVARVEKYLAEQNPALEQEMKIEIGNPDFMHIDPIASQDNGDRTHTITFCVRHGDKSSKAETVTVPAQLEPANYADVQERQTAGLEEHTGLASGGVKLYEEGKSTSATPERNSAEPEDGKAWGQELRGSF